MDPAHPTSQMHLGLPRLSTHRPCTHGEFFKQGRSVIDVLNFSVIVKAENFILDEKLKLLSISFEF